MIRTQRSVLAKLFCGVASIRLETCCYEGISEEDRLCQLYDLFRIEPEY